jgi:translocation and assembly module TamB
VFEGYEINDLRAEYSGGAERHEAQASFSFAGARGRIRGVFTPEFFFREIEAELHGINLAVLDPELPQTALQLRVNGRGSAAAFAGKLALANPDPGPIDRERLPFTRAEAEFSTDLKTVELKAARAVLHPAGSVQGRGRATLEQASFDIRVAELDLRGLYSSLRQTQLSGPLELELSRDRQRVKGTLAQQDMSLAADAERRGDDVEVHALRARAGDSEASGSGRIHLGKPVRFRADLTLARFDPARFGDYPGGSINGSFKLDGDLGGTGSARWEIANSELFGEKLESAGSARLIKDRIYGADAWATLGRNRATAKGAFGGPRDRLAWTLHVPDLAALAADFGGEIRASGTAGGTWKSPNAALEAQASQLRLGKLAFDRATVKASGTLEKHEGWISGRNADLDFHAELQGGWRQGAWRGEIVSATNSARIRSS